jgi:DNA-directed RNA polymerase subunit K/omega
MLINVVSRRVRQLNHGQRPLVKVDEVGMSKLDLALKEIAEGKLAAEISAKPTRSSSTDNLITL